jgi:hypothetical protein
MLNYVVHAYIMESLEPEDKPCTKGCTHKHHESLATMANSKDPLKDIESKLKSIPHVEKNPSNSKPPVRTLISDSKNYDESKPFELRIGYKFSFEALEQCITSMQIGEKSRFLIMPEYCNVTAFKPGLCSIRNTVKAVVCQQEQLKEWKNTNSFLFMCE